MPSIKKILPFVFIVIFITGIILMISDFKQPKKPVSRPEGGEDLFQVQSHLSDEDKVAFIKDKLATIQPDTNYFYSFSTPRVAALTEKFHSAYMSSEDIRKLKSTIGSTNKKDWSTDFFKVNPRLKENISVITNFSRLKKTKVTAKAIGDISFCLEDTMTLDGTYRALLIVSRDVADSFISKVLDTAYPEKVPKRTKDSMILSKRIFATLMPSKEGQFRITRTDLDSIKSIDFTHKDYITWEWIVAPLVAGESSLILKLSRLETPAGELDKFFPSKLIKLHVTAEKKGWFAGFADFIKDEWKWILTSLVSLAGWVLAFKRNKKGTATS